MKFWQKIFNRNKITAKQQKTTKVNLEELQKYIQKNPSDSLRDIAKEFNVHKTTINRLITKFDLNYQRKPSFKEIGDSKKREVDLNEIKKYIKNNSDKTLQQISNVFDISEPYLRKLIKTNNIEYEKKSSMSVFCRDVIEMKKAIAEINNRLSTLELLYKTNNKAIAEINNDVETNKAIAEINDETIFSKTTTFEGISYDELKNFLIDNYYKSNRDIAKHFGVTAEHIYYLINKYELGYLKRYNYKRNLSYKQTKIEKSILKELFNNDQHVVSSSINIDKDKTTISKRKISYDELKNYIENNPNQSLEKIGMHFGRGRSYIQTLIAKYRIKYETKNKIKIDIERLRKYVTNNPKKNNEEIAAHFGMSKNRITVLIREFGISHGLDRYKRLVEAQQLREHIKNNPRDSLFDIGMVFGVTGATISRCIKKYNIEYKRKNKH